jgi:hypothetical protein
VYRGWSRRTEANTPDNLDDGPPVRRSVGHALVLPNLGEIMFSNLLRTLISSCAALSVAAVAVSQNQALSVSTAQLGGYIEIPPSNLLAPPSITIEAWVTYDDATLPSGWVYPTLGRKEFTQGVAEWFLRVNANNNGARTIRLWVNGSGGVVNVNWNFAAGALLQWTHIAATYDGSFARIYVNGVQVAQANGTGPLVALGAATHIGAGDTAAGSANERWNGLIDEVRIWSTARTQQEIATGMFQQILSAPNLVASYQLNGNGLDASGNNAHGALIGNPVFVPSSSPAGPSTYCTAGTSSHGCQATIAADANPNVAHTAPCHISVAAVEGQKVGIIFYGLATLVQPWCSGGGGTSFLCVKPPTQRTLIQSSGGTTGQCDGAYALDWNAFQLAYPGSLGSPWSAGTKSYVQGWYRDPLACKTTSLTDAVELTYMP